MPGCRSLLVLVHASLAGAQPGCTGSTCTGYQPDPAHVVQIPISLDGSEGTPSSLLRSQFNATLGSDVASALATSPAHVSVYKLTSYANPLLFGTVELTFMSPESNTSNGLAPASPAELDAMVAELVAQLADSNSTLVKGSVSSRLRSRPIRRDMPPPHVRAGGVDGDYTSEQMREDSSAGDFGQGLRRAFDMAWFSFLFAMLLLVVCTAPW